MIVDKLNELSDGQVVTAAAASTNTYDFGQTSPTPGSNGVLHVVTTVEAGSTGLIQVKIQECDTESGTYTDLLTGPDVTIPDEGLIIDLHSRLSQSAICAPTTPRQRLRVPTRPPLKRLSPPSSHGAWNSRAAGKAPQHICRLSNRVSCI